MYDHYLNTPRKFGLPIYPIWSMQLSLFSVLSLNVFTEISPGLANLTYTERLTNIGAWTIVYYYYYYW